MAKEEKSILSLRLKLLRVASGMRQEEVADMLGIGRSAYTYYELSRSRPDYDALIRLAKLYNVTIDYLVGISNFPVNEQQKPDISHDNEAVIATEATVGKLGKDERYLVGLYRQLSESGQMEIMDLMKKKRDRGE